jgi:hypothetical protein
MKESKWENNFYLHLPLVLKMSERPFNKMEVGDKITVEICGMTQVGGGKTLIEIKPIVLKESVVSVAPSQYQVRMISDKSTGIEPIFKYEG